MHHETTSGTEQYELPPPIAPNLKEPSFYLPKTSEKGALLEKKLVQLHAQGFPRGLSKSLFFNAKEFPLRIWVVDNSGSMTNTDGHRFVETSNSKKIKVVSCTRWAEIKETVLYHAEISALLQAPTIFRARV